MVKAIQAIIVQCITSAVLQVVTIIVDKILGHMRTLYNDIISSMKEQLKQQSYQWDKMEQYIRIRKKGLSYTDNENTNKIVMKPAGDIRGAAIQR